MVTCAIAIPAVLFESSEYARTITRCTSCTLEGAEYAAPASSAATVPTGQASQVRSPVALAVKRTEPPAATLAVFGVMSMATLAGMTSNAASPVLSALLATMRTVAE